MHTNMTNNMMLIVMQDTFFLGMSESSSLVFLRGIKVIGDFEKLD